jgi:carbon monoxide dehydrogenase subunit G
MRIEASREVSAPPAAVFAFLSDLENHWKLTGRWVEAVALADSNGSVRIHGPLGLRRTALTTVVDAEPDKTMHGTAELSGGTLARIAWDLEPNGSGTAVFLSADVERTAVPDRIMLALGGRAWMTRRFAAILARLDEQLAA